MECHGFFDTNSKCSVIARLLFILLCVNYATSCHKSSNKLDEIRLQCGPEINASDLEQVILKFSVDPAVTSFDSKTLQVLALDSNQQASSPTVTSRGCVLIPKTTVGIRARSNANGQSLTLATNLGGVSNSTIRHLQLLPSPQVSADFLCPKEGVFGYESVKLPLRVEVNGRFENLGIEVIAKNLESGSTSVLIQKKFGDTNANFNEAIDILDLPVGSYELSLAEARMEEGLEESFKIAPAKSRCVLTKVAAMPVLTSDGINTVIRRGEPIAVAPRDLKLRSCSLNLAELSLDEHQKQSCELRGACLDPLNFKTSDKIVAERPGSFRYYYQQEDRLGQLTNLVCHDVVISEVAPAITIQWEDAKLNLAPTSLDLPYSKIALSINASHPDLNGELIKGNHFCSATIATNPLVKIPAKVFTCTSKECLGKSLDQPVPCGNRLEIDLTRFYELPELWDSTVIVKVATTDGTGLKSEAEAGIFFHSSMWTATEQRDALKLREIPGIAGSDYFRPARIKIPSYNYKLTDTNHGAVSVYLTYLNGLPLVLHGDNDKSIAYSYTRSLGNISYVLWSDGNAENCKIRSYDPVGTLQETIQLPKEMQGQCAYTISMGSDNSLWVLNLHDRPHTVYVLGEGIWTKRVAPELDSDYCPNYGNSPVMALDKDRFIMRCYDRDGREYLVPYSDGTYTYVDVVENAARLAGKIEFHPSPTEEEYSCKDDRLTFEINGREVYYPWKKILNKAFAHNPEYVGTVFFNCEKIARSANSIIIPMDRFLYTINVSSKRALTVAHLPPDMTLGWRSIMVQGHQMVYGFPNPVFYLLKNYQYSKIDPPPIDEAQAEIDSAGLTLFGKPNTGINKNGSFFFKTGSQAWIMDKFPLWTKTEDPALLEESRNPLDYFLFDYPWVMYWEAVGYVSYYDFTIKFDNVLHN